jgi:hypothetical protein
MSHLGFSILNVDGVWQDSVTNIFSDEKISRSHLAVLAFPSPSTSSESGRLALRSDFLILTEVKLLTSSISHGKQKIP